MPKIFMSYPEGAFSEDALDSLAEEITNGAPSPSADAIPI